MARGRHGLAPAFDKSGIMTGYEDPNRDRLRQHFAQRVVHQARHVLEVWQRLQRNAWNSHDMAELVQASERLGQYARRFEQPAHAELASAIGQCLLVVSANHGRPASQQLSELNSLMQRLSHTGLRQGDTFDAGVLPPLRKPIYLALQDPERRERLTRQLEFFGLTSLPLDSAEAFRRAMQQRYPAAIVMEVDFCAPGLGLRLVEECQQGLEQKLPVLFFSEREADTPTRLAAVRAGGLDFFCGALEASALIERLEDLTRSVQCDPYKVLIVDDSRAQATFTERTLNGAGIVTRTLTDPIRALAELNDFQPDLIILDMYMPECLGTELAQVIRHNERYVSVPIIYLSAEDDIDKQLGAMSEGGDDFLTKPVEPRHLIATVRNRAARARNLRARMVRDSLTGLYNHTHILQLLDDARLRARRDQRPLSFAMLDIDHFKKVNDGYGHPMGDRVIKSLALFLKQRLRKTDHIGRYGGEEFAVVLPDTDGPTAAMVINRIRERFAEIVYPAQPQDLRCTFSCGIAELHDEADAGLLAGRADEALYVAKRGGRNRVEVFEPPPAAGSLLQLA